jgi:hypothetical protein
MNLGFSLSLSCTPLECAGEGNGGCPCFSPAYWDCSQDETDMRNRNIQDNCMPNETSAFWSFRKGQLYSFQLAISRPMLSYALELSSGLGMSRQG